MKFLFGSNSGEVLLKKLVLCRDVQEDVSMGAELSNGDIRSSGESPAEKTEEAASAIKAVRV